MMLSTSILSLPLGVIILAASMSGSVPVSAAFTESYCSSQNTNSSTSSFWWQWQSNGKCTDHCNSLGSYAYAVIQYQDCWCTNYIPRQQTDISKCDVGCPGYPDVEHCGSKDDNLFIYIQLAGQPSGTAPGSQAVSTSNFRTPTGASSPQDATTSTPSSTMKTAASPSAQATVQIVTESGAVVTRTIYQTPTANASSSPSKTGNQDSTTNVGAIAGGVTGGVAGLIAIIGGLVFVLWRRRKKQREAHDGDSTIIGGASTGITRNTSTMSKSGLLGQPTEREVHPYAPHIATNFSTQNNSRYDQESISPVSNRRNSQPLMIDSRLNPNAVLTFAGANASRDSLASMDDSRDYGRQLNIRNPDPS